MIGFGIKLLHHQEALMRKMCGPIVLIFTLGFALGAAYGAPPTAVLPVSGTQSQMSSEALSPEARQKIMGLNAARFLGIEVPA